MLVRVFLIFVILVPFSVFAKISIATTTTDLEALVKEVAKDQVEVFSIAKGTQDPHHIEAKPSYMVKLRNVDLVLAHGLELETAWIEPLIQGSRNSKLNQKGGVYELAPLLDPIDVRTGSVSRAEGDVHPGGSPHFQLDPVRMSQAALLIAEKLSEFNPEKKKFYSDNAESFQKRMTEKTKVWSERIQKSNVKEIVTYHKTFGYFCMRFKIKCELQIEPKPGIPPTASHLLTIIDQMKSRNIKHVLIENLYEDSVGAKIKQSLPESKIHHVPVSIEGEAQIKTIDDLIERLVKSLEGTGV